MKHLIFYLSFLFTAILPSQEQFEITENGLIPQAIDIAVDNSDLYNKALQWMAKHTETYNIQMVKSVENQLIQFTSIKGNAVSLDKQFYNARYTIELRFTDKKITFQPTAIDLKLNSKYDMGWKSFKFNNFREYFKKSRPIRKYREYLCNIALTLNRIQLLLADFCKN